MQFVTNAPSQLEDDDLPSFEPIFPWAAWSSTDMVLPESIHHDAAEYRKLLEFCREWLTRSAEYLSFPDRLTHFLLLSGLVYRELDRLLFQEDPDTAPYPLPDYTINSLLTQTLLAGLSSTFNKLSETTSQMQLQATKQDVLSGQTPVQQKGKRKAAEAQLTSPSSKTSPTTRRTKRDRVQTEKYRAFDPVVVAAKPSSRRSAATAVSPTLPPPAPFWCTSNCCCISSSAPAL